MANQNFSFPLDSFGTMQTNPGQHLTMQPSIGGAPDAYPNVWAEYPEQFRNPNSVAAQLPQSAAAHQVSAR
jgi:hypothetical protein